MTDQNDANDWIDDLTNAGSGISLFEDSFRSVVEEGELGTMAPQTLEDNIDNIDDKELLADAIEEDDREECEAVYRERLGELNAEGSDDGPTPESGSTNESTADSEPSGTSSDGGATADDVPDDVAAEADALVEEMEGDDGGEHDDAIDDAIEEFDEEEDGTLLPPTEERREEEAGSDGDVAQEAATKVAEEIEGDDEEASVDAEVSQDGAEQRESEADAEPDPSPSEDDESSQTPSSATSDYEVDIGSLAPGAVTREEAAQAVKEQTLLAWGPEGSGKSHVAHTAPEPICYIDTEGKADELAEKFDGKQIWYWTADDYKEAKAAMEEAFDVLDALYEQGVRGTLAVDSMTAMWEYAKVDWAKFKYQTEDLSEVTFGSQLEGDKDWTQIKARHNEEFRERILESPYHVVFTAGETEDYNAVMEGGGKKMKPDGEKWNKYAVKDVVRLRVNDEGVTVGDLRKAARTRYSFVGLEWPTWDSIYDAIEDICSAEQSDEEIDLSDWPFEVVDGQPVETSGGSDDDGGDES